MLSLLLATGTSILVAGQPVEVGRPVVLWSDPEGFNGYAETCVEAAAVGKSPCCEGQFKRYQARSGLKARTLEALREVVTQLVLHLDGCVNSRSCFYSMHDLPTAHGKCGLSAHFMVDFDGTIYETLDPLERAWHAEQENNISIGIEICNRGDAGRNELDRLPSEYRTRPVKDVTINGHLIHAFDFRPEQYESVTALTRALLKVFPQIKPVIPTDASGKPIMEVLPNPTAFKGIVGHYHVDLQRQKWDPGALDWDRLLRALNGFHFPFPWRNYDEIPKDATLLYSASSAFFRNAEERASGFFPLAPGRLWHSGAHLRGGAGEPVHAPARGRVLAARLSEAEGSSNSFVLIRHDLTFDSGPVTFFSLLMHLGPDTLTEKARASWLRDLVHNRDQAALDGLRAGRIMLLDRRVEAGDIVGTIGVVRRGVEQGPEMHLEIFSADRLTGPLGRSFRFLEAAADGPVSRRGALSDAVDANGDGLVGADELRGFFRGGDLEKRQALRRVAIRHAHEWGDRLGEQEFVRARELAGLPENERRHLYRTAMAPYVFWTDALSAHAGLPPNQTVYSYHPITFLVALAAHANGTELHWPARAPLADRDLEATPLGASMLGDWIRGAQAAKEGPIFGPLVHSEAITKRKADIPLIILPGGNE